MEEGGVSVAVVVLVERMMTQVPEVEEKSGVVGEALVEEKILSGIYWNFIMS